MQSINITQVLDITIKDPVVDRVLNDVSNNIINVVVRQPDLELSERDLHNLVDTHLSRI